MLLKAKHSIDYAVLKFVKLSYRIKNFEKWREVMVMNFFELVLKRFGKSI